jgi:hypothetical protein
LARRIGEIVMATTYDLVRRFFPEATDEECDFWLWETTCYPFGSILAVARQLKRNAKAISMCKSVCPCCGLMYDNGGKVEFHDTCGCVIES